MDIVEHILMSDPNRADMQRALVDALPDIGKVIPDLTQARIPNDVNHWFEQATQQINLTKMKVLATKVGAEVEKGTRRGHMLVNILYAVIP